MSRLWIAQIVLLLVVWMAGMCRSEAVSDPELYRLVQNRTFQFFYQGAEPHSQMARERMHVDDDDVVTTGGTGFGLMAILVGIQRGWITRQQGFRHLHHTTHWLAERERYHGAWPHWLHGRTGETVPFAEYDDGGDLVKTSYLVQGMLCVRQYFKDGNSAEQALATKIDQLWREVEWDWYQGPNKEDVLYWHWSPNYDWKMNMQIRGWNECLITYVLAASSPTHNVSAAVYHEGWANGGKGYKDVSGVPLFYSHYSFLGLDPRGLSDRYSANYWDQCVDHALFNYDYFVANPKNFTGYGPDCWGLTSSYTINDPYYAAHSPENDLGIIAPTAALSSFPYTPKESMAAMRHFYDDLGEVLFGTYGFYDAFSQHFDYFPRKYLAIDQGPTVVMMENQRTGLLWYLFMTCPEVREGLSTLEFEYPSLACVSAWYKLKRFCAVLVSLFGMAY